MKKITGEKNTPVDNFQPRGGGKGGGGGRGEGRGREGGGGGGIRDDNWR